MYEWHKSVQIIVNEIDNSIRCKNDEQLTLEALSGKLGYSAFHTTRKFKELAGISLRDYLRLRKLAFALIEIRDLKKPILQIAVDYGFSSHEAFSRAFKSAYGVTPKGYRKHPVPVVLRTKINTFDRYILGIGEIGMIQSSEEIKIYYVSIPEHKFMHIKNYESNGYFDFWEKQAGIPGQDCDTICGLLDSIKGKLDGEDDQIGSYSGQIMAHMVEADGKKAEGYGIRLPIDYSGMIPKQMLMADIPEAEYIVFEHGAFDYENENITVGERLEKAMQSFDWAEADRQEDKTSGRIAYFYHDPEKYEKWIIPVRKK